MRSLGRIPEFFTTEEAEKLLASTLARAVGVAADSKFISEWNKPAHGLRVYVNADGEINTVDFLDRPSTGMKGLNDALELSRAMQYGNPLGVLVASETDGWKTKSKIIKLLFQPSIQLYVIGI